MEDSGKHAIIGVRFAEALRTYAVAVEAFDGKDDDETRARLADAQSTAKSAETDWLAGVDTSRLA